MKKLLTNNLGYKILSLAVAILLWMIVVNNENPVTSRTFSNVPVSVTNAEIVTNKGNTYRILEDSKNVSVTITAQRSVINQITVDSIKATANMENLDPYSGSLIPVEVSVPGYTIASAEANPRNIQVKIEMESTKTFPIIPKSNGTPRDGYEVGALTVDPKEIEVSGPESIVDSISQVVAEVNVAGMSKNEKIQTEIVFYDEENMVIDTTLLRNNLGEEGVSVDVAIYQSRAIPVTFDTSAISVASGYVFEGISVEPKTVSVIGPIDKLSGFNEIVIPADELRITGLKKNEQKTIDISPYLPEWATVTSESTEIPVIVKIYVTKEGTKTMEYATGAISIVNCPKGYTVDYGNVTSIEIVVRGSKDALEEFELTQGSVSINLIDIDDEGEYIVPVQVAMSDELELDEAVMLSIKIIKVEE